MEEVKAFKCNICGKIYHREFDALHCEYKHAQYNLANCLLRDGQTLSSINYWCGFGWNLTDEQKGITKDNCFTVSHWQCCDKPAYKITEIDNGYLRLCGCGSWSGYYGNLIQINRLPAPHPKEKLFVDPRYPLK